MSDVFWPKVLENLLEGKVLKDSEATSLMQGWLDQELTPVQTGAFLTALRAFKPELI